jgi:hypothetical protein
MMVISITGPLAEWQRTPPQRAAIIMANTNGVIMTSNGSLARVKVSFPAPVTQGFSPHHGF